MNDDLTKPDDGKPDAREGADDPGERRRAEIRLALDDARRRDDAPEVPAAASSEKRTKERAARKPRDPIAETTTSRRSTGITPSSSWARARSSCASLPMARSTIASAS